MSEQFRLQLISCVRHLEQRGLFQKLEPCSGKFLFPVSSLFHDHRGREQLVLMPLIRPPFARILLLRRNIQVMLVEPATR